MFNDVVGAEEGINLGTNTNTNSLLGLQVDNASPKKRSFFVRYSGYMFAILFLFLLVGVILYETVFSIRPAIHNILIVVDMQNDYCSECKSPTVSKWALAGLPAIASYINEIHQRHLTLFDKVVFTQDWLPHGSPFLVKDSFGAQLIHALDIPKNVLTFTKSSDDWMNRLGPTDNCTYCDKSYDGEYHFALNGERAKGLPVGHPTLDQYLTSYGYPPEETRLVVTGIAENRCVMKGSVHAVNLGYKDVILYLPGTGATNVTTEENWDPKKNAPEDSCELTLGVSECTEEQEVQWRSEVYTGYKGGPTSDDAVKIMKNALEKIATTKEELLEMMK